MIHCYLDDSGTHSGSPVCVLAGYFGGERHWRRFDVEWRKALEYWGVEEFHANRFGAHMNGKNIPEFKGWNARRTLDFIERLLIIISSHRIYPLGSAVLMKDWNALPNDEKAVLTGAAYRNGKLVTSGAPNKTYLLPFLFAIQTAAKYCHTGKLADFSFDRYDYLSRYAQDYFDRMRKFAGKTAPKLGNIFFVDSKHTTPIQAADLLAHQVHMYARERIKRGLGELDPSEVLYRALNKIKNRNHDFCLFDARGMGLLLKQFRTQKVAAALNKTSNV